MKIVLAILLGFGFVGAAQGEEAKGQVVMINRDQAVAQALELLEVYPKPKADEKQTVIFLPETENEFSREVDLIAGKVFLTDCNDHYASPSSLTSEILQGWGLKVLRAEVGDRLTGTYMGCPGTTKSEKFVRGQSSLRTDYHSQLPIVIYSKPDVEIRYRVWAADGSYR